MGKEKKQNNQKKHKCKNNNLADVYSKIIKKMPAHITNKMFRNDTCSLNKLLEQVSAPQQEQETWQMLNNMQQITYGQQCIIRGEKIEQQVLTKEVDHEQELSKFLSFESSASRSNLNLPVAYDDFKWMAEKQNQIDFFL